MRLNEAATTRDALTSDTPRCHDAHELFRPGDRLDGKFVIERKLGEGGMGVVYLATHLQLQALVAMKFLRKEATATPELFLRFEREARVVAKIKSEYVARVYDVGTLGDGMPYMVMEFVEGHDLATALRQRGTLPIQEVVEYGLQVCEALSEAHAAGIVHRDLKPANLFAVLSDEGRPKVKVLDFGVSKLALGNGAASLSLGDSNAGVDLSLTRSIALIGSPLYMSPEQMNASRDLDHRSDLWSLGVVLFELLSGVVPFPASSLAQLCTAVLEDDPPSLTTFRPDVPASLDAVIRKCLERDVAKRFQNVAELAVALLPFAPRRSRTLVERTLAVTRKAGMTREALVLPPSSYPMPSGDVFLRPGSMPEITSTHNDDKALRASLVTTKVRTSSRVGFLLGVGFALAAAQATGWVWSLRSVSNSDHHDIDRDARTASAAPALDPRDAASAAPPPAAFRTTRGDRRRRIPARPRRGRSHPGILARVRERGARRSQAPRRRDARGPITGHAYLAEFVANPGRDERPPRHAETSLLATRVGREIGRCPRLDPHLDLAHDRRRRRREKRHDLGRRGFPLVRALRLEERPHVGVSGVGEQHRNQRVVLVRRDAFSRVRRLRKLASVPHGFAPAAPQRPLTDPPRRPRRARPRP